MTKEEKILWATWMASTDISEYMVDIILDFNQMDPWELNRIWEEGLHIFPFTGYPEMECVVYPLKAHYSDGTFEARVIIICQDGEKLGEVLWDGNPILLYERIVAELKRVGFAAPWVSGMNVKNILVATWGKNWNKDD